LAVGRAFVYALGVILYEALTGRVPFPPDDDQPPQRLFERIQGEEPPPPRALNRQVPRDLDAICRRCLDKEAGRRVPTAAQLAEYLRDYLDGRPCRVRPAGRLERGWRWCRKNPVPAVLLALLMLALLGGTAFSSA
jgi:serine/threonine-protein kinase